MADEAKYEAAIRTLIRLLHDGEKGFREVGGMLRDGEFRRFFVEESAVRAALSAELERALGSVLGAAIQEDGTAMGSLHRAYFELRDAMGANDEKLLEMSAQCERLQMRMYRDVLKAEMPGELRTVVAHQDEHIRRVYAMLLRYVADARASVAEASTTKI